MGEVKIPLSVIQTLLSNQNDFNQKLVELLSLHLKQSALAYERALNPPIQTIMPMDAPRMFKTEEEEDLEFAYRRLIKHFLHFIIILFSSYLIVPVSKL